MRPIASFAAVAMPVALPAGIVSSASALRSDANQPLPALAKIALRRFG